MTNPAILALAAAFGLIVGSFLNVCIVRWPQKLSVVRPRSRCVACGRAIAWYENVPVVSWLVLRGRCRGCAAPISMMYPIIELAVGLGWAMSFLAFGATFTALRIAVFGTVLLGVAVTDAMHYTIPDGFTVFGLIWNLGTAVVAFAIGDTSVLAGPYAALLGACVGAGSIAIVGWLGEVALKKEAMGFGDVTLMGMAGAALGPERALLTVFVAAALGAAVFLLIVLPIGWFQSRKRGEVFTPPLVPFGVFLAPASLLTLLWGSQVLLWYKGLIIGA